MVEDQAFTCTGPVRKISPAKSWVGRALALVLEAEALRTRGLRDVRVASV